MDLAPDSSAAFQRAPVALCHLFASSFGIPKKKQPGKSFWLRRIVGEKRDLGGSVSCLRIELAVFEVLQKLSSTITPKKKVIYPPRINYKREQAGLGAERADLPRL